MLKFETSPFQYIVDMNTFPSDNTIISYNDWDILYLDKTETEGFYSIVVPETEGFYFTGLSLRRASLNCLLTEDKIYTMKEEPCYYA